MTDRLDVESPSSPALSARDRLVDATVSLLAEPRLPDISTRAITDRASVTAPTLYHHFRDKDSLLKEAALTHFSEVVESEGRFDGAPASDEDGPIASLRRAWDTLVEYGLEYPRSFELLFGATRASQSGVRLAARLSREALLSLSRTGALAVEVDAASRSFLAANIGAALLVLADPEDDGGLAVSRSSRDGILRSLLTHDAWTAGQEGASYVTAAIALNATLQSANPQQLSEPEFALFLHWLDRLAAPGAIGPPPSSSSEDRTPSPSPHHDPAEARGQ